MRRPPANPTASPAPRRTAVPAWLLATLLALAIMGLYWPSLHHGFVNYDDDRYVTNNAQVQQGLSLQNLRWAFLTPVADNWHPLTVLSYMLICQLSGLNPWPQHLANLLLHAANAALVFILLRRLTGSVWKSFFAAALFAAHPLRVESVAWIAERKDVLSGCFGLLALIAYAGHARKQEALPDGRRFVSSEYWLALTFLALGLMSKPMLVTWPFVLLLLDYWPLQRFKAGRTKQLILEKVPFVLLAGATSLVTFVVQWHGAAIESIQNLPLAARCENALISFCRYLGKTLWPTDLAVLYPHPGHWPVVEVMLAAVFLAGITALFLIWRRQHPYLLVGWLWFGGTLVPVIGLVQVGTQAMADRYTYLPSVGVLILIVWGAAAWTQKWRLQGLLLAVVGSLAIAACMGVTRRQLAYWRDGETLFRHTLAVTGNNVVAQYNLGVALDEADRTEEAITEYRALLAVRPDYARAHVNLGADLDKTGQPAEAMVEYQEAIRLAPDNFFAHNDLGMALFKKGQTDEAVIQFQEAVRLTPESPDAHNDLAAALYTRGQHPEAIQEFEEALRLNPDYAEAHFNFGCVLAHDGQTNEAVKHLHEAIRLKPDYAEARKKLADIAGP